MAVCINVLGLIFAVMTHTTIALIHELFEWHPQFKRHPSIPRKAFVRKLIYRERCHTSPRPALPCHAEPTPAEPSPQRFPCLTLPDPTVPCPVMPSPALP